MVIKHEKKNRKKQGYQRHCGLRRRGSGNRGGVGAAGHGKRGKQKKHAFMENGKIDYGKHGFTSKAKIKKAINVGYLNEHLDSLCENKQGKWHADIRKLGFSKVLGSGAVNCAIVISNYDKITSRAKEKIVNAGGEIIEK